MFFIKSSMSSVLLSTFFAVHESVSVSPYVSGILNAILLVCFAAILEAIGKRFNYSTSGMVIYFIGVVSQVLLSIYFVWGAFFLIDVPLKNWPIDIPKVSYVFMELFYVITLILFTLVVLWLVASFIVKLVYGKKEKKISFNKTLYTIFKALKIIIVLGVLPWAILITQSSIYFDGVSGRFLVPLIVITIVIMVVFLILPYKLESGKQRIRAKKRATKRLKKKKS